MLNSPNLVLAVLVGLSPCATVANAGAAELEATVANVEVFKTVVDAFPIYGHKVAEATADNGKAYNFVSCPDGKKLLVEDKDLLVADKCPDGSGSGIFAGILSQKGSDYALDTGDSATSRTFPTWALSAGTKKSISDLLGKQVLVLERNSQIDVFQLQQ